MKWRAGDLSPRDVARRQRGLAQHREDAASGETAVQLWDDIPKAPQSFL